MGLIDIELFATLDLVGQLPGGPDEDPEGFSFGGWQAPLLDEVTGAQIGAAYEGTDALLLGRSSLVATDSALRLRRDREEPPHAHLPEARDRHPCRTGRRVRRPRALTRANLEAPPTTLDWDQITSWLNNVENLRCWLEPALSAGNEAPPHGLSNDHTYSPS